MLVSHPPFVTTFIGIGSNLAEPLDQVQRAVCALRDIAHTQMILLSPWYGSSPVGGPADQPDYVNGVACLHTALSAHLLLDALQAIEQAQGRERSTRWGARTLDLDILLYGESSIGDARLQVPHPRMYERAFVLVPLAEIAADLVLPNGCTVRSLLSDFEDDGSLWRL
jgi:2-amino-4-hydroxy-6-hydroxymethyldihydropteridine diphosphokinase